jgi:hypothetical protein
VQRWEPIFVVMGSRGSRLQLLNPKRANLSASPLNNNNSTLHRHVFLKAPAALESFVNSNKCKWIALYSIMTVCAAARSQYIWPRIRIVAFRPSASYSLPALHTCAPYLRTAYYCPSCYFLELSPSDRPALACISFATLTRRFITMRHPPQRALGPSSKHVLTGHP